MQTDKPYQNMTGILQPCKTVSSKLDDYENELSRIVAFSYPVPKSAEVPSNLRDAVNIARGALKRWGKG